MAGAKRTAGLRLVGEDRYQRSFRQRQVLKNDLAVDYFPGCYLHGAMTRPDEWGSVTLNG